MPGRIRHRVFALLAPALFAFAMVAPAASASPRPAGPPVRSASEIDYPPYCFVTGQGEAAGFSVELLRAALAAMGRKVVFRTGTWPEARRHLEEGRVEVLPLVGRTPEREALYDFTVPYLTMHGAIVVRRDEAKIHAPKDLAGRRVAVLEGDNAEEYLRRADLGAIIVPLPSFQTALKELSGGRHDAVVVQKLVALEIMRSEGLENLRIVGAPLEAFQQNFCFAVRKGDHELLATLNEGLALIRTDGTFRRLYTEWFAPIESLGRGKSRIVIGGDRDYPPYEYLDQNGQPAGFNVELTLAAARRANLEVEIRLGRWSEIRAGLASGEIDAAMGMFYSSERDRLFAFSPPHSRIQHVIVTRQGAPPASDMASLAGRTILVMAGDIMDDLAVEHGYETRLVRVASQQEALHLLATGKYDGALVARIPALYWIAQNGWRNLVIVDEPVLSAEYCYAVPRGREDLLEQLTGGLIAVSAAGEDRQIRRRWLDPYDAELTIARRAAGYALTATISLLAILVASVLWSRSLHRLVDARTRELSIKTALLEAQSAATIDGVLILDQSDRVLFSNERFAAMWGMPTSVLESRDGERIWGRLFAAMADSGTFRASLNHGRERLDEHSLDEVTLRDGRIVEWHSSLLTSAGGQAIGRAWYFRDVTESRRLDEQLFHSRKMESVGQLAGGVAHDFNNLLTVILGAAADLRGAAEAERNECLDEILAATERARELTRQLLLFSGKQLFQPRLLRIDGLFHDWIKLIRRILREDIELVIETAPDPPRVRADAGRLQQTIVNLVVNARDAMPKGGRLTIATRSLLLAESGWVGSIEVPAGRHLAIEVRDTGTGIPPEIVGRIFDPFFTTKERGKGTGLGLSTVYGIVQECGGRIGVESAPGKGSVFTIVLPAVEGAEAEAEAPASAPSLEPAGGETILLVEDNEGIVKVTTRLLTRRGYVVVAARNGGEAVEAAKAMERIDLLLTDIVMPRMNGFDLADRLRAERPGLPILYMSGYVEYREQAHERLDETNFIAKPFQIPELLKRVRSLIDARAAKAAAQ